MIEKNLLRGDIVEVNKGFLIENLCAMFGVRVMRPTTLSYNLQRQATAAEHG
jgi:hypothetical protein